MSHKVFTLAVVFVCLTFGILLTTPAAAARHDKRRPEPPPPPPPCAKPKADVSYEVRFTSIDAGQAALPAIDAALASTSNRDDQRGYLQAQAKNGVPIFHIAYGPTVRVPQDEVNTGENLQDVSSEPSGVNLSVVTRSRVTVYPHLNARCAEAVDIAVEQWPAAAETADSTAAPVKDTSAKALFTAAGTFVFENGDTKLLTRTLRQDGTCHLIYATVFFPPRQCIVLR